MMNNLESYVKWRGDIRFKERKFNDIDNLVFSALTYLDMKGTLNSRDFIPLKDLYFRLMSDNGLKVKTADNDISRYREFLRSAAHSDRFGNIVISDYVDMVDEKKHLQFSAMVFHISQKVSYIAFRGTDETLVGWREDFIMAFSKTASHDLALKYTDAVMQKYPDNVFFIGGHSKGGNLALYAAARLSDDKLARVRRVYVNDGPGLSEDVFKNVNIDRVKDKTTKIIPEFCVIGKLFDTQFYNSTIVKSSAVGILQHDIITWEICDGELSLCHENAPESIWINQTLEQWLGSITIEERKKIVDRIFDSLKNSGVVTLQDLSNRDKFGFDKILRTLTGSDKTFKHKLGSLPVVALFDRTLHTIRNGKIVQAIKTSPAAKAVALIVFGILFLLLPEHFIQVSVAIVLLGLILFQIFSTVKHLMDSGWNFRQNRTRVYAAISFIVIYAIIIVKQNALFILSSAVFGIGFLTTAYNYAERLKTAKTQSDKIWLIIKAGVFIVMGLCVLVVPSSTIKFYSISVGIVFVADGIYRLITRALSAKQEQQ